MNNNKTNDTMDERKKREQLLGAAHGVLQSANLLSNVTMLLGGLLLVGLAGLVIYAVGRAQGVF